MEQPCNHEWVTSWLFQGCVRCVNCGAVGRAPNTITQAQAAALGFVRGPDGRLYADWQSFRPDVMEAR